MEAHSVEGPYIYDCVVKQVKHIHTGLSTPSHLAFYPPTF